jgi:hypothetical protein
MPTSTPGRPVILGPAASPALRERLIQLTEAALRSEDLM